MNPKEDENNEVNKTSERKEIYKYLDLDKITKKIYKEVEPAIKEEIQVEQIKSTKPKKSYPQDWTAYNQAQQIEKIYLMHFLDELLDYIPFPEVNKVGRKPVSTRDKIFYLTLQAYNIKSSRRCIADLEIAKRLGFIDRAPHFNTILKCLKDSTLMTYFKHLINVSGIPLQQVETDFAVDSSGFSTSQFDRWFDVRFGGKETDRRRFRKCHLTCGVKTNIITAVNITSGFNADSPQFKDLVLNTKKIYDIREISADKAYSSRENLNIVSQIGGIAFIPFKKSVTKKSRMSGSFLWKRMYKFYSEHQEEFMQHYHKRSNSESTFHMLKIKFGSHLRSKYEMGQINEILAKCLCHNLCVLTQEMFELGINVDFKKCAEIPIAHNQGLFMCKACKTKTFIRSFFCIILMKGVIVNFRGGLHTQKNDEMVIKVDSSKKKSDAEKLVGKKVVWVSPAKREIKGTITKSHGNKGVVRAIFEKGMPGQAVGTEVKVE